MAQNNAIFNGGSKDGHDKGCYTQTSNLNTTLSQGGNGDGHSKDCYTQATNLNMTMSAGGSGDGHSKDCYTQTSNLNLTLSAGGSGDGYSKDCYTQASNLNMTMSAGGSGDGYATSCYTQQSNLNNIFSGGDGGDGKLNGCANEPLGCFLAINLGNDTSFCTGQTLTLNAGSFPGGATYEWQDGSATQTFLVDTTGTYYVLVTDTAGCTGVDSIVVTVNPVPIVNLGNDTAFCAGNNIVLNAGNTGATYVWQNNPIPAYQNQTLTVNTSGIYFVTASFGTCTDTDSITVTVNPIVTTNLPDSTICQGNSALIFGVLQSVAGTYRDTILSSTGCDSILVQQLNVNPTYNQNLGTVTICNGDSALILGNYETVAGTYTATYQTINGCDSTVSQTLNVSPTHVVNLGNDTAFCAGNSLTLNAGAGASTYQWMNGTGFPYNQQTFTVSSTGTYYVVTTLGACTTSDTINVIVNPIVTTNLSNEVVCQGDSALIFGNYQTVAGNYYDTLTASTGCDSILVKQLIVNLTYNQNLGTVNICQGDSALILGNYETIAGTYSDTLMSINGCDSIVYQTLNVSPSHAVNLGNDTAFCAGNNLTLDASAGASSYQWMNGTGFPYNQQTFTVSSTGTYYVVTTLGACTTSDTINIIVNPIVTTNLSNEVVCQGDSALIFGNYQTVAGNYYDTLTASTGCDSILVKQLILNPVYNQNLTTITICSGDSALIFGTYQTVSGTYSDTLTSINGCDSIVNQPLSVLSNSSVNLGNDTAFCAGNSLLLDAGAGNSYTWQDNSTNQTYLVTTSGQYYVTVNVGSCSANDTINVTVNPIPTTNLPDVAVCQGDSALIFGNYQTVAGNYYDTLVASTTCDSIVIQQLIINPTYNYSLTPISICQGDSALIFGNYETVAGTYYDSTTTVFGCDSIVAQELIINPYHPIDLGPDTTVCENVTVLLDAGAGADTYQWQSNPLPGYMNQTFGAAGAGMYYVVATIGVCSSSDTINVNVIPTVYTNLADAEVCQGDSALIFGNYETVAGTYNQVLTAASGCDSILVQELIVHPNYVVPQSLAICQGDSVMFGGIYQYTAGTYYDTLQSVNTCDSIIATTLIVNPTFTINTSAAICQGDSIMLGGAYQTVAGVYTDVYSTIFGCDSTVNTTLNINPTYSINQNIEICFGDSIMLGGAYQNSAGVYTDVYSSIFGCDSTVVTTLGIKPIATETLTPITICDNDSALIFGNYQTVAGIYSTVIPNGAVNGCDSIVQQELIVNPTYQIFANATICSGDSIFLGGAYQTTAGVYVDVYSSSLTCDSTITTTLNVINSFTININDTICAGDSILLAGAYQTVAGTYTELLVSSGGCDSLVITELYVNPLPVVTLTADPELILSGQSSQLTATGGGLYTWTPTSSLSCINCANPIASPTETTLYTVEVNLSGCIVSDTITVSVDSEFKIPEGFSPNGDGVNDVFEIVGISQFPNNKIMIVNRWGNKVFEAAPYKSDWDGTSQFGITIGEKLPSGTYFYILDLGKTGPSGSQEIKGYIYINR
ncbi:MAG: gliding motility-associated C-terminal domain-containing protein [Flavobacteriales bacterium]|nr:gliding motility-associated C-terminal domain-containing protein [Flavobacteriales bacterium]MCB9174650.1 gliding motility-associated C-terminal domain-containing protein [Flavobacteriales bacterium]